MKKDGGYGVDETHTNQSRATEVGHVYLERLEEGRQKRDGEIRIDGSAPRDGCDTHRASQQDEKQHGQSNGCMMLSISRTREGKE
jgi:hypothetical protein